MNVHKNARMTALGRVLLVKRVSEQGWRMADAAEAAGVSTRTGFKWLARWRSGEETLYDRSSAPARRPTSTPAATVEAIETLRRQRLSGPAIARKLGLPRSSVGLILRRLGLGRLSALDPKPPENRYERAKPGELIHVDTKKLGRIDGIGHRITGDRTGQSSKRGTGWEVLHVAIDDASRLAYTEVLVDETKESVCAFTTRALLWFASHGAVVERLMSDNGSAYKSHAFRDLLASKNVRHLRTRPYTPRTNGKAERFIQTSLREWAYAAPYNSSAARTQAMYPWINAYNVIRPHSAHKGLSPWTRLNNLLGFDI